MNGYFICFVSKIKELAAKPKYILNHLKYQFNWLIKRGWKLNHVDRIADNALGTFPSCGGSFFVEFWIHKNGKVRCCVK